MSSHTSHLGLYACCQDWCVREFETDIRILGIARAAIGGQYVAMTHRPNDRCAPPDLPADATLALRVHMMPSELNTQGTVFGGTILSLIDQAGFYEARKHGLHRWVTVAMDGVEFRQPVFSGDVVSLYAHTARPGRTSVNINVFVQAERYETNEVVSVTVANLTMVSVDKHSRPIPFNSPPSIELLDRFE